MSGSKNKILFLHKSLMLSFVKGHLKSVVFGLSVTTWKGLPITFFMSLTAVS